MRKMAQHQRSIDNCGIFGMLQHDGGRVRSTDAVRAICAVQYDRGSPFGAGLGYFHVQGPKQLRHAHCKLFVREQDRYETMERVRDIFSSFKDRGVEILSQLVPKFEEGFGAWRMDVRCDDPNVMADLHVTINNEMKDGPETRAYMFSTGRYSVVYKGVMYADQLADRCGLEGENLTAELILAHTRQATNSLNRPFCSHPFAKGTGHEFMAVHNGEINSVGVAWRFLRDVAGLKSFAGPDSEVIPWILDYLVRVLGLSLEEALLLLMKPYERLVENGQDGRLTARLIEELRGSKAAALDGPFSVAIGYTDGNDTYLAGISDRGKLRPLVVGRAAGYCFVASEERQITGLFPRARVWAPEPGRFFLASTKEGIIYKGQRERAYFYFKGIPEAKIDGLDVIDASMLSNRGLFGKLAVMNSEHVVVNGLKGHRCVGSAVRGIKKLTLIGTVGNLFGEFNVADVDVHGNVADGALGKQNGGDVYIWGKTGDVVMYAADGGRTFVRNSVGNRAAILMREYEGKMPVMVVGTKANAFFGEYMSGGLGIVLNLGNSRNPVAHSTASGMVGGKIYIRGHVDPEDIGLPPLRQDIVNYLDVLKIEDLVDDAQYAQITRKRVISEKLLKGILTPEAFERISVLFKDKGSTRLKVEFHELDEDDRRLVEPHIRAFVEKFGLQEQLERLLTSNFTVIEPLGAEVKKLEVEEKSRVGVA